jgi:hypothetical protein
MWFQFTVESIPWEASGGWEMSEKDAALGTNVESILGDMPTGIYVG